MIILETNVLSALMSPMPDPAVIAWLDSLPDSFVWTSAITVFEIRSGIELLPLGRRRQALDEAFARVLATDLQRRVLPFDAAAAQAAGTLEARRRRAGFTDDVRDTQIAGIALARQATLATRNVKDFRDLGVRLVNPWDPT
jgi:toxin FitB